MHNEECLGRGREGEVYLTKNQQGKKIVVKRYNSECKISEDLEQYYNSAKEYREQLKAQGDIARKTIAKTEVVNDKCLKSKCYDKIKNQNYKYTIKDTEEVVNISDFLIAALYTNQNIFDEKFIHGDIKPENFLSLTTKQQIKILIPIDGSGEKSGKGVVKISTGFYYPNFLKLENSIDIADDIYALGITLAMLTIKKENRIFINTDLEAPEKIIKEHEKFIQYIPKEFNEVFKKLTQPNEEIRMKEFEEMATKSLEKIKKLFEEKRNSKETKVEKKKEYKWEVVIQPQVRLSNTGQINQTACSKHEEQKIENSREKMQSYIEVDGVRTTERGIIKTKSKTTTPDPYRFIPQ